MSREPHSRSHSSRHGIHEKFYINGRGHEHLTSTLEAGDALKRIRTAGSISISPELFEKIYLSPHTQVKGDLRKTFGNPTPLALLGFVLSLSPLACDLMGWRNTNSIHVGDAGSATYYYFGGLLMLLGGIGEWILGNTFPFVVFCSFGAYWFGFASTLTPYWNAWAAYANSSGDPETGLESVGFHSSFAFILLFMGVMCLIYLILALRTNVIFCLIFLTLLMVFCSLAGAYWQIANGNIAVAGKLQVVGGAFGFASVLFGWYIFFAIMLQALDFPIELPVGDLSSLIMSGTERKQERERYGHHV